MNGRKALIVDDSRLAQFVLKKMLVDQNIDVDTSSSAEDALVYLKNHKPDIIFLDHTMPGMNGLEVLKVIKADPNTAPIPVMMYTSQEDSNYMSQARDLGALEVLPKQLKSTELTEALTRVNLANEAANDTEVNQEETERTEATTLEENKEELEKLVYNAEIALSHESAQQKLQQKLEQQREYVEKQTAALHSKIDGLIPAQEKSNNRQSFWNNLLWGAIYCATIVVFSTLYFQQKNEIQILSNNQKKLAAASTLSPEPPPQAPPVASNVIEEEKIEESNSNNQDTAPISNTIDTANNDQLSELEKLINTNNQIPFDELLLGETAQASLNELIQSLRSINFSGRVAVIAHDGNFCVNTNESGQFALAIEDIPVTQCQITESNERLADIASIGLLQLITASNQSPENDFVITINPTGANLPLEDYPEINDEILAGAWNEIALKNRRVEIKIFEDE